MKLNNKGFAITGILYTVLILFLLILSSLLLMLTTRINRLIKLTDNINKEVENSQVIGVDVYTSDNNENKMSNPIVQGEYFITNYKGKYEFIINDNNSNICYSYLPENTLLSINNGNLQYKLPSIGEDGSYVIDTSNLNNLENLIIFNCQNQNITKVKLEKVYTSTKD